MNTAILFDDPPLGNEDKENYEKLIEPMLAAWLPFFRQAKSTVPGSKSIIMELKNVALMAWLAAKGNIPVTQRIVEGFREIFLITRNDLLADAGSEKMAPECRTQLEKSSMRLAKAITVLDLANDPEIEALFPNAGK